MRLTAADLSIERGGRLIFSHLSFCLDGGEALAVIGANGAGKSSLLRALAGLLRPMAGQISLTPKMNLTLAENLAFWSSMLATGAGKTEIGETLQYFGLKGVADLPAAYLSAGQRRRAALARLLVSPRPIWLLDEPLTALDLAS